jgi:tRNA G18 (ribose-2'-O)-methylase SpoU
MSASALARADDPRALVRADDPRAAPFRLLRDPRALAAAGLFAVEGRLAIERLLGAASRFRARAILATPAARLALAPRLAAPGAPLVFTAEEALLQEVVGHALHRGAVAVAERGAPLAPADVIASARAAGRPLLVCEKVSDPDNVGALFRNAVAFAAGGVLLAGGGDPLYRKAVRTSMGACLELPFAACERWPDALGDVRAAGYRVVALAPRAERAIDDVPPAPLTALLVGSEGGGLSTAALAAGDLAVRIPIAARVDSLNVASAAAIALHRLAPPEDPCGS